VEVTTLHLARRVQSPSAEMRSASEKPQVFRGLPERFVDRAMQSIEGKEGGPMRNIVVVLIGIVVASCGSIPQPERARVVQLGPSGEASENDLREGVRLLFDRPVVAAEEVGRELPEAPVRFTPAVEGRARWLDRQTLVFTPSGELKRETRYRVALAAAPGRTDGAVGKGPSQWSGEFVYERLEAKRVAFASPRESFQPPEPVVAVIFNHQVAPGAVARHCLFDGPSGAVAARLAVEGEPAAATTVRVRPSKPLPGGSVHHFRCSAELRGLEGSEGLARDVDQPFRTYGPLAVESMSPTGRDVAADDVVVQVSFANPVPHDQVSQHVALARADGKKVRLAFSTNVEGRIHSAKVDLESGERYVLTVKGALRDAFDQKLGKDAAHDFFVGDASPRLSLKRGIFAVEIASGRYPVWTRNLSHFDVTCARVPEARYTALLTGPMNYDAWYDAGDEKGVDYSKLGTKPHAKRMTLARPKNKWADQSIDLAATCGGDQAKPAGLYLLEVASDEAPLERHDRPRRALANVTDLGLVAKVGNASSLVWVVRLSTGKPVAGATVAIRDLKGRVKFTGQTGAEGTVLAPGATKLAGVKPAPRSSPGSDDGDGDGDGESFEGFRARRVIVTARLADDLAVLDTNWNNGVQIWNFGVPEDRGGGTVRVRGFLQSDRGIYRPGDTVHLRGLLRVVEPGGAMRLPKSRKVKVVIEDPRGQGLVEEQLALSSFGGFNRDLRLPAEARLGDYVVTGSIDGQTFRERFAVEEYRPRTFEVKAGAGARHVFLGERLRYELKASYLYGAPLARGKVSWAVRKRPHLPEFPGYAQYTFQDFAALYEEGWYWARHEERSFSFPVGDGEKELDPSGHATVSVRDDVRKAKGPFEYLLEATVSDASGQAVTVREITTAHKAGLYVGVHPAEFVQAVEMPFAVQAVALSPDGKRRAVQASLTISRRRYECESSLGRCSKKDETAAITRPITIPETGAAVTRVVLKDPGQYTVRLEADDERGGRAVASEVIYVIGAGEAFWSGDEGDRMGLVASKPSYKPGETARLVPQANLPGATALVTIERDGIVRSFVRTLKSTGEGLDLPIDAALAPNAFASVTLVRGRQGEGLKGRPRFKMGVVNLEVDSSSKRLTVALETDKPSYRPGDTVNAALKVTTHDGRPVLAELAVAAADEGVLQIAGYKTPDPMKTFYQPWGLGVESSTTWNRIAVRAHPGEVDPEEGGDGGGDEAGRIRSRFVATAFWAPALRTGADGTARFSFTAPDNLTAFRVMAVAADAGDRFGSGEMRFTVAKALLAMPALPRFIAVGDQVKAAVVVHNNTGASGRVVVTAAVTGAKLRGAAEQEVEIAAGSSKPVIFPVTAAREGRATFRFGARLQRVRAGMGTGPDPLGAETDTVEITLPVGRPLARETVAVAESRTGGRVEVPLTVPAGVLKDEGSLELVIDTTGLASMDESLRYLVGYPYGCLEQTTSKVVPMVALGELVRAVDLPEVSRTKLKGYVETGIAKILRHQHEDGAFGLWPGAPAEPHLTAYALWGLHLSRQAGYRVDGKAVNAGLQSLRKAVNRREVTGDLHELGGRTGTQAFALYVLAAMGAPENGAAARLYEQRRTLPLYGKAFLARALAKGGQATEAQALVDEIAAAAPAASGPVLLEEQGADRLWWYMSSGPRTTAIVLSALLEVAPAHPLVARLEAGLLAARQEGRWSNTQENLYAMVALADLGRARSKAGQGTVTVTLGGRKLLSAKLKGADARRVSVPMAKVKPGTLVVEASGREVFYAVRLRVARPLDGAAVDHGLAVEREYLDARTGEPVKGLKVGQVVKVRVTVKSAKPQTHVAVVDRLPAGLEPVLDRFEPDASRAPQGGWWERSRTTWTHRQLRDDRVEMFADVLAAGASTQEYLARATSAGTFVAPPAMAEAMYRPALGGRSGASTLTVSR
jgi:alpha-2-macroglobulin